MKYLLLSGSFHSSSRSLAILKHIETLLPANDTSLPELNQLPFYCEDIAKEPPSTVRDFLNEVTTADALIICTPEYNHSLPAVLKNALDWASRPAFMSPLKDMPVTIITQADSPVGGARAQAHLKLVLDATLSNIHSNHELLINNVATIFDQSMRLTDTTVEARVAKHLNHFKDFVLTSSK